MFSLISNYTFNSENSLQSSIKREHGLSPIAEIALPIVQESGRQIAEALLVKEEQLMSKEEIKAHSLLESWVPSSIPLIHKFISGSTKVDAIKRMVVNFLGGGLFTHKENGLDGFSPRPNYVIWEWLLQDCLKLVAPRSREAEVIENMLKGIVQLKDYSQECENLSDSPNDYKQLAQISLKTAMKIKNLKPGESQSIYGGWSNFGGGAGHAQIYEFARRPDSTFDVYFYTSTGFKLADYVMKGEKLLLKPIVRFEGVPESVLVFNRGGKVSPAFIQHLIENHVLATWDKDYTANESDVLGAFEYLENYRVRVSLDEIGAITGQRGGTCVPSVTRAWIRRHCQHLGLYKQIIFRAKLRLLISTYQEFKEEMKLNSGKGEECRRLLETLARKLLRRTSKLSSGVHGFGALVDHSLSLQARATSHDILRQIMDCENSISEEKRKSFALVDLSTKVINQRAERARPIAVSLSETSPVSATAYSLPDLNLDVAGNLLNFLDKGIQRYETIRRIACPGRDMACSLQINYLIDQLPIPKLTGGIQSDSLIHKLTGWIHRDYWIHGVKDPLWDKLSTDDLEKCLNRLTKCMELYCYSMDLDAPPRRFATVLAVHALTHFLALKIDAQRKHQEPAARLENYHIPVSLETLELEGLVYFNRAEFRRIQEAVAYFKSFKSRRGLKNILFQNEKTTNIKKTVIEEAEGNGVYWDALLKADQELDQSLAVSAGERWPDLSHEEIESRFQEKRRKYDQWKKGYAAWQNDKTGVNRYLESAPDLDCEVNLPLITKKLMLLEESGDSRASNYHNNVLSKAGYHYVNQLRRMTYLCNLLLKKKGLDQDGALDCKADRKSPYELTVSVKKGIHIPSISTCMQDYVKEMHRSLSSQHQHFFFLDQTSRKITLWEQTIGEGRALDKRGYSDSPLLTRILRTLSQWELTPNQLIYEVSKELEQLKDASFQGLFYRLFFRSPIDQLGTVSLGVGDLLLSNEALLDNCEKFITRGLNHFINSKSKIDGGRFFFELSFFVANYLHAAGRQDLAARFIRLKDLSHWLKLSTLTNQDLAVLRFFQVLFYSIKGGLEPKEYADLYAGWIQYNLYPSQSAAWKSPSLKDLASRLVYRLSCGLSDRLKEPDFCECLGSEITALLNLGKKSLDPWKIDARLVLPFIRSGDCLVDLALGEIFTEFGKIESIESWFPWERQEEFRRIFATDPRINYQSIGKRNVSFSLPDLGTFRLISSREKWKYDLQRWFPQHNCWAAYQKSLPGFPEIFQYDHCYWIPLEKRDFKCLLTSLKEQRLLYGLTERGKIIELDDKTGQAKEGGLTLDFLEGRNIEGIEQFESRKLVLSFRDSADKIQKILFPRYVSQDGNSLAFERQGEDFIWTDNRHYKLSEKMPSGLLGSVPNYLHLAPVDGNGPAKILVPFQEIEKIAGGVSAIVPSGTLKIQNYHPLIATHNSEQTGCHRYFAYQVGKQGVIPTSLESKLFLSYLYLTQLRHQDCIDLLRSIKTTEDISSTGSIILEMMVSLPVANDHPEAKMARLQALALVIREKDKQSKEPVSTYFKGPRLDVDCLLKTIYGIAPLFQSLNNVSVDCRLKNEDLQLVLRVLKVEGSKIPHLDTSKLLTIDQKLEWLNRSSKELKLFSCETIDRSQPQISDEPLVGPIDQHEPVRHSFYSNDSYLTAKNVYERRFSSAIAWLKCGEDAVYFSRPPRNLSYKNKNGKIFLKVCEIAKSGSETDREAMKYQILQWNRVTPSEFFNNLLSILENPSLIKTVDFTKGTDEEIYNKLVSLKGNLRNHNLTLKKLGGAPQKGPSQAISLRNYPLAFRPKEKKSLSEVGPMKVPLNVLCCHHSDRWNQLKDWKSRFLREEAPSVGGGAHDFNFHFDEGLLSQREQTYVHSIKRDLQILQQDYDAGKVQNESTPHYKLASGGFREEIAKKLQEVQAKMNAVQSALLTKANLRNSDELAKEVELSRIGGGTLKPFTLEDAVSCLLSFDMRTYRLINDNLNEEAWVREIAALTLENEDLKSYEAQLKRIDQIVSEMENATEATERYLGQKIAMELDAGYHFDGFTTEEEIAFRVFAGETGIIPLKKQMTLIKKMVETTDHEKLRDIVIQLIMGGGKTSVIATIVLYLSAQRKGRLPLFLVPAALFETVKTNLRESMLQAFRKDILAYDLGREDLTLYRISVLYDNLMESKVKGLPIVMSVTTLQCLELELLSQARQIRQKTDEHNDLSVKIEKSANALEIESLNKQLKDVDKGLQNGLEKAKLLSAVVKVFSEHADALLDEVDVLLDCLQEVNFPDGEEQFVKPVRNLLLHTIYTLLSEPPLKDFVRLHKNEQSLLGQEAYFQKVVPEVSSRLANVFKPIADQVGGFKDSYIRYVSGRIPAELQLIADTEQPLSREDWKLNTALKGYSFDDLQSDLAFLRHLEGMAQSTNVDVLEAAQLIALSRHLVQDLLPTTLSKSGGRDYGTTPSKGQSGKMIPYLGVNTPATTEFGYHWEAAAFYYQWALAFTPEKEQILEISKAAEQSAKYYMQKNEEKFEETAEFQVFYALFGVNLDEISLPGKIEEAISFIEKDQRKRLDLAYETISRYVDFRKERLTSNGMALLDQLSIKRAMSGTPWNVEGYEEGLAKRFEADVGTEGKILHKLAARSAGKKIYEVDFKTISECLGQVFGSHPAPRRIRGIIESGGLFKGFHNNAEVAEQIMKFLESKQAEGIADPNIEGVLFFHKDPGQRQPNTLYVWKKGAQQPERIGGSSVTALQAKGLNASNYFVYYDERHTTGTDILQVPDCVNLVTVDEKMLRRTLGQGIMRLRQFLFEQDVDIVVTKEGRASFINGGKTIDDVVLSAEKVQSVRKTQSMVRYFNQQIHNIFRRQAVKRIRGAMTNEVTSLVETIRLYEPYFVTGMSDSPYLQFGRLTPVVDTKKMLRNHLMQQLKGFVSRIENAEAVAEVKKDADKLALWLEKAKSLPEKWTDKTSHAGVEQEVSVQLRAEVQVQVEMEIEQEVELELRKYDQMRTYSYLTETRISFETACEWVNKLREGGAGLISLNDQLRKFPYSFSNERIDYAKAFSQPIFGTQAFFHTYQNTLLPVFHASQRPAKQILAVLGKDQKMRWLMVSEYEANDIRSHIEKHSGVLTNMWLLQPDGTLLARSSETDEFPDDMEGVAEGLLEINAFTGNADYLDRNVPDTEAWLVENVKVKTQFLKLRTFRDTMQNQILRRCPAFLKSDEESKFDPNQQIFRARAEREKKQQGKIIPASPQAVKLLQLPRKIGNLNVAYVRHLEGDQLRYINPFQGAYVSAEQVVHLPLSKIQYLENPDQIYRLKGDTPEYLLSKEQALCLQEHQKHLIPFVNPEFYSFFRSSWQIGEVLPQHIHHIHLDCLHFLRKNQIKSLSKDQACHIEKLPPNKQSWIHGNLLVFIPPQYVCREQISEITDPGIIPSLESLACKSAEVKPGTWTSWISFGMVKYIDPSTQLAYLSDPEQHKEHVANVPNGWVKLLKPEQIAMITKDQVPFLEGELQIRAVPNHLVMELTDEQIDLIDLSQVPFLRGNQISKIKDVKRFDCLLSLPDSDHGWINQMPWIVEEQYPIVNEGMVRGLLNEQLLKMTLGPKLQKGLTKEQIESFNSQPLIDLLNQEQIHQCLMREQVTFLKKPWQIQACPDILVKYLELAQIEHIKKEQVLFLQGNAQIQACPDGLVNYLTPQQVNYITPAQVKYLNPAQVPFCPFGLVNYLEVAQIEHIKKEQVPFLEGDTQIQACPVDLFLTLPNEHPLWKRVPVNVVKKVGEERIGILANDMLRYLEDEGAIKSISFSNVQYLTREQLRKRSWSQFLVYTIGVLTLGVAMSIVAILAHVTLTTLTVWLMDRKRGRRLMAQLHSHPVRLYKYFQVYAQCA